MGKRTKLVLLLLNDKYINYFKCFSLYLGIIACFFNKNTLLTKGIDMKKLILSAIVILMSYINVFSQQDAIYSQYMFNQLAINPAYAGIREVITGTLIHKSQWVNMPGAPSTQTLSMDAPITREKVGVGLVLTNDRVGIIRNTGLYASYAYRIEISKKSVLSMGLQAGFSRIKANLTDVIYAPDNNTIDPVFGKDIKQFTPNFGFGLYYTLDKLYVGLSSPHLLRKSLFSKNDLYGYRQNQHIFLSSGYSFDVNNDIQINPSTLIKFVKGAPLQFDINAMVVYLEKYSSGLSFRSGDCLSLFLEFQANKDIHIGYAFDYSITKIRKYNAGSHELMFRYDFNKIKPISMHKYK